MKLDLISKVKWQFVCSQRTKEGMGEKPLKTTGIFHFSGICLNQSNHLRIMLPWDWTINRENSKLFTAVWFLFPYSVWIVIHCCPANVVHFISISFNVSECPKHFENLFTDHHYHHHLKPERCTL